MSIGQTAIQYDITPAQLQYKATPTEMAVSVNRGGLQIERDPIRLEINNEAFFDSIGIKSIHTQTAETIQKGKQAVHDAAARYTQQKNLLMGPDALNLAQIAAQQKKAPVKTELAFLPKERPEISWSGGTMAMQYTKDDIEISWSRPQMDFTYVPYSVDFYVDKWSDFLP